MSKRGAVFLRGGWQSRYRLPYSGTPPSVVLDFVNQRYFDGSVSATLGSLVSNPGTIDANGMLCTAVNIAAIGKLLTVFQQPACTVRVETNLGNNATSPAGSLVGFDTGSQYAPLFQGGSQLLSSYNGATKNTGPSVDWTKQVYSASTWDRSSRNICMNAGDAVSGAGADTFAIPTTVNIGSSWGTFPFTGYIRTLAVWPQKVSAAELQSICWPFPFLRPRSGTRGIGFGENQGGYGSSGVVLQYERTQPWTIIAGFAQRIRPQVAAVISTNVVNGPPWNGYELWIDDTGVLRVRIMGNWQGTPPQGLIDVVSTTNVCDGLYHVAAATYDGSSTAAGVTFYLDGVPQTKTVVADTLTSSIKISGQNLFVGNQVSSSFSMHFMDYYQVHNVARSAAYMAAHSSGALPPLDANVMLSYNFEEGGFSGTTADASGNGYTSTFTGSAYWVAP